MMRRQVDDELVARAIAWCGEAGRSATPEQVRAALAGLAWDELLAARALLADPPPARPLGPMALADMARGAHADVAAEREREGKYPSDRAPAPRGAARTAPPHGRAAAGGPRVRRARDRVEPSPPAPPRLAPVDEFLTSEGRAVLERLVRENGARRGKIVTALARGWGCADGSPLTEDDLSQLLEVHGLARGFERRERDELLHALRAAAGVKTRAAAAEGLSPAAWDAALERLGAAEEAEAVRAAHREELRRRATLSERVRMLLVEGERLQDLGLLAEIEADVRARLPEHVRALRASGAAPLGAALARSLAVGPPDIGSLTARLGIDLPGRAAGAGAPGGLLAGKRPRKGHAPGRAADSRSPRGRPGAARGRAAMRPQDRRPGAGTGATGGNTSPPAGKASAPGRGRPQRQRPGGARGAGRRPTTKRS